MKNVMKSKRPYLLTAVFLFLLTAAPVSADIVVDSSTFNVQLGNGAYITNSSAAASLFSRELFKSGDGTNSGTIAFSDIPYFDVGNTPYFQFVYDVQETRPGREIHIDQMAVSVSVDGTPGIVWNYDGIGLSGPITLNSVADQYTDSPLGAGGDMELYVPVSLFSDFNLKGSDLLTLAVTQSLSDNGPEEWVVLGSAGGGSYFGANDPIIIMGPESPEVPIPGAVWLLGSGLIGLVAMGRRRLKK